MYLRRACQRRMLAVRLAAAVAGIVATAIPVASAIGALDPTFGAGGKVITDVGAVEAALAVLVQANGRIVLGGSTINELDQGDFVLSRYLPNGAPDKSFGQS